MSRKIVSMRFSAEEIRLLDALAAVRAEQIGIPVNRTQAIRWLMTEAAKEQL